MPSFSCNDAATAEIYPLPLHDALPIYKNNSAADAEESGHDAGHEADGDHLEGLRSEEHTSELQSRQYIVCRLFLVMTRLPPRSTLFPSTTLFRSTKTIPPPTPKSPATMPAMKPTAITSKASDRKSTRLNSSHANISYAVFFL